VLVLLVVAGWYGRRTAGVLERGSLYVPAVGPLEDGLLITPVSVRGHGPYLWSTLRRSSSRAVCRLTTPSCSTRSRQPGSSNPSRSTGSLSRCARRSRSLSR